MITHWITHFDETYMAQGLAMIQSLLQHVSEPVHVNILWLGEKGIPKHELLKYPSVDVMSLNWFEEHCEPRMAEARLNRSWTHYCWSLEAAWTNWWMKRRFVRDIVCYCDADMFWMDDPIPTINRVMEKADVALSPHWFPPGKKKDSVGYFNFGIGVFRVCDMTRILISEWLDKTLAKCDDSMNDQHHLDSWPEKLGVHLEELPFGVNCGPWSLPEARPHPISGKPMVRLNPEDPESPCVSLISYHGHEFRRGFGRNPVTIKGDAWNLTNYPVSTSALQYVYEPIIKALEQFL